METAFHSPIEIDGISQRKQEGAFIFSPISDNRVSRYEQEEEGAILGAAKWLVIGFVVTLLAIGAGLWAGS